MNKLGNIEHSTPNAQRPKRHASDIYWTLDVGCWVLNVCFFSIGGLP